MLPTFGLQGKTAFVTGASGGLGAHFAATLASCGAKIILGARRTDELSSVAAGIRSAGGHCSTVALDVTDAASLEAAAAAFGQADILVNNAGIVRETAFLDHTASDWDSVLDTNLRGMFLVTQAVAGAMKAAGRGGSVINIASIVGLRQSSGIVSYAVSKAAAIQLTKVSALELARFGIRVNALAPGYVETDINREFWDGDAGRAMIRRIPQRRLGRAADLDGALVLLASDASQYMTGSVIEIDGGHLCSTL